LEENFFIQSFQTIYGKENVTFNVHALLHIAKDVKKYGPLDKFSAFCFESYLCSIKKLIRKGDKPLQQIARRLTEYELLRDDIHKTETKKDNRFQAEKQHFRKNSNLAQQREKQYKILKTDSWSINIDDDRNNTIMLRDSLVIKVLNIIKKENQLYIIGQKYLNARDLFTIPGLKSSVLGICIVSEAGEIDCWTYEAISCKILKVACTTGFISYPIIHTFIDNK